MKPLLPKSPIGGDATPCPDQDDWYIAVWEVEAFGTKSKRENDLRQELKPSERLLQQSAKHHLIPFVFNTTPYTSGLPPPPPVHYHWRLFCEIHSLAQSLAESLQCYICCIQCTSLKNHNRDYWYCRGKRNLKSVNNQTEYYWSDPPPG